jgi:membrane-associated phospholipid phosphatase
MSLGKIAYHAPRPYMVDSRVETYGCSVEYGNPSGHSLYASSVSITIFLDIYFSYRNSFQLKTKSLFYISLTLMTTFILLVAFSRVYNGDHSIDQCIFGLQLGVLLAFFMHNVVKKPVFT